MKTPSKTLRIAVAVSAIALQRPHIRTLMSSHNLGTSWDPASVDPDFVPEDGHTIWMSLAQDLTNNYVATKS